MCTDQVSITSFKSGMNRPSFYEQYNEIVVTEPRLK